MGLEGIGFNRRRFRDLSEQEVLALAISSEEDDARIYRSYAERLRAEFPDSAAMFDEMAAEEDTHRQRLIELHRNRFGEVIPLIRREHVAGYYARRPVWLVENLGLDRIRAEATAMEQQAETFYLKAAQRTEDAATRKLLGDLARAEAGHRASADRAAETHLDADARESEDDRAHRQFVLTWVQPGLAGLMDGSVSTLAPIFATAFATQDTSTTFLVGLAASVGAGISMGFTEAASDDGELSGRGSPVKRGFASGIMTMLGGLGHALPYLIPDFWTATITAIMVVFVELWAIVWIQNRYMETPFLRATFQVVLGGALVWRRRWDSNPRYAFTHAGFQDRCIRPLCHSSGFGGLTRTGSILKAVSRTHRRAATLPQAGFQTVQERAIVLSTGSDPAGKAAAQIKAHRHKKRRASEAERAVHDPFPHVADARPRRTAASLHSASSSASPPAAIPANSCSDPATPRGRAGPHRRDAATGAGRRGARGLRHHR
jgi:rubrerythrin